MNEPIDVATAETVAFLTQHLPRSAQLIEVGCGKGHVAQALQDRGYRVDRRRSKSSARKRRRE